MSWQETPSAHLSPDGRLRLIHGPIDLIIKADGPPEQVKAAYHRATAAFKPLLQDIASELPRLRQSDGAPPTGAIARKMSQAIQPFSPVFITPMAAVAGAVADHILAAMLEDTHGLIRAQVNNGGDIALWTGDMPFRLAICEDPRNTTMGAQAVIGPHDGIGGVATSGWRGRSHSLGIADAVTVLAATAAQADAAATLIANAVDLPGYPQITRAPANTRSPDSDLGTRLVTTHVPPLPVDAVQKALENGATVAQNFLSRGLIIAACLASQGQRRMIGTAVKDRTAPDQNKPKELHYA